jgi:hypothetical protein
MQEITTQFIRTLASANGIQIPDDRLELVRAQYETFIRTLAEINSLELAQEAEPAILFSLMPPAPGRADAGR